jgi:uncharacterized protein (DUF433 family)
MMIPRELEGVLSQNPNIMSGSICFTGTRVPVLALLDTILCGQSVGYFLQDYPDVTKAQALSVLTWEQNKVRSVLGLDLASQ